MGRSSRNFQPSSSYRKFQSIFGSLNRYFRENSCWVPLNKYKLLAEMYCGAAWHPFMFLKKNLKNLIYRYVIFSHDLLVKHAFYYYYFCNCNEIPCINNVTLPYLCDARKWFQTIDFLWLSMVCVKTTYFAIKKQSKCHAYYCSITNFYGKRHLKCCLFLLVLPTESLGNTALMGTPP